MVNSPTTGGDEIACRHEKQKQKTTNTNTTTPISGMLGMPNQSRALCCAQRFTPWIPHPLVDLDDLENTNPTTPIT
jgi:hypothetical protein